MNVDRNNLNLPERAWLVEPLPEVFEQESIEVDRLLAHVARVEARNVPAGLSQRVFEMSVEALPDARVAEPALRLVDAGTKVVSVERSRMFVGWSRFALAASVLMAAGVTLWTTWPQDPAAVGPIASNGKGGATVSANGARVTNIALNLDDLNALNASNPSMLDSYDSYSYLLDASEVRSFDDLNNDLVLLVQKLEM